MILSRKATLNKIAKRAGVSKSTVSRALKNEKGVSKGTSKNIKAIARSLGYKSSFAISTLMSTIRTSKKSEPSFETIAFVNAKKADDKIWKYSAISEYLESAKRRAKQLGYAIYDITLDNKQLTPEKFERTLLTRNIRGGLIFGHYHKNSIPKPYIDILKKFKFVSMGVKSNAPVINSTFMDRFVIIQKYITKIAQKGYKHIGFVIEKYADDYEDGKFVGGYLKAQFDINNKKLIPAYYWDNNEKKNQKNFLKYLDEYKIDALFSYSTDISDVLDKMVNFPASVKCFHYDRRFANSQIAKISNQKMVGITTIDILTDILLVNRTKIQSTKIFETTIVPKIEDA
ncbi:MAG: LacI family transcriptional regulator [Verrucomicrobiaceae bacterium]|nr:LacI family transcriptional regulator [Verrucomicrobiaceae bacterium]